MNPQTSSTSSHAIAKPRVYWDRTDKMVRDWTTDQALPNYEGPCMFFSDLRGAVVMYTFVRGGIRHWHDDNLPAAWTVEHNILHSLPRPRTRNE